MAFRWGEMAFRTEKQECRLGVDSRLARNEVVDQGRPALSSLCHMQAVPQPFTCTEPMVGKELSHLLAHLTSKQLRRLAFRGRGSLDLCRPKSNRCGGTRGPDSDLSQGTVVKGPGKAMFGFWVGIWGQEGRRVGKVN